MSPSQEIKPIKVKIKRIKKLTPNRVQRDVPQTGNSQDSDQELLRLYSTSRLVVLVLLFIRIKFNFSQDVQSDGQNVMATAGKSQENLSPVLRRKVTTSSTSSSCSGYLNSTEERLSKVCNKTRI